jgi:hypothetical protein
VDPRIRQYFEGPAREQAARCFGERGSDSEAQDGAFDPFDDD